MKEFYKIGEISKIYGIGQDSLRYYEELGLLRPKRAENGYRLYGIRDIRVLNIIRELRGLDFSMTEIKEHLKDFNLQKTRDLFIKEKEMAEDRIVELEALKSQLETRIADINRYLNLEEMQKKIELEYCEKRHVIMLSDGTLKDDDLDFVIKRLQLENQDILYIIGNGDIGGILSCPEDIKNGKYGNYTSVFYIVDKEERYDHVLPEGMYLTYLSKGKYESVPEDWKMLLNYAYEQGFEFDGPPIELYVVDNHDTSDENEFITKLEIKIKKI